MRNINISHFPKNTNQPVFLNEKKFCFMKVKTGAIYIYIYIYILFTQNFKGLIKYHKAEFLNLNKYLTTYLWKIS